MATIRIKTGDTYPLTYTLLDANKNPIDLSDCTVTVSIGSLVTDGECTTDDETDGLVTYNWIPEPAVPPVDGEDEEEFDLTDTPGMYPINFKITSDDGTIRTLPVDEPLWLFIMLP